MHIGFSILALTLQRGLFGDFIIAMNSSHNSHHITYVQMLERAGSYFDSMIPLAMSTRGKFSRLTEVGKEELDFTISEIATDCDMDFEYHPRQKFTGC